MSKGPEVSLHGSPLYGSAFSGFLGVTLPSKCSEMKVPALQILSYLVALTHRSILGAGEAGR